MRCEGARRAVFLDRDGVLNRSDVVDGKPYAPREVARFDILPDAALSVARLKAAGFLVVVVTNQPDVGNGFVAKEVVEAMNAKLSAEVAIDDIRACFHSQRDGCNCRKPRPGMLLDAKAQHGIDLAHSYMVGDRWGDIACGQGQGCFSVFIERGYSEGPKGQPDAIAVSLAEAVDIILARE